MTEERDALDVPGSVIVETIVRYAMRYHEQAGKSVMHLVLEKVAEGFNAHRMDQKLQHRCIDQLGEALIEVLAWVRAADPDFLTDPGWEATMGKVKAALEFDFEAEAVKLRQANDAA